jgi:hypothetical protein
MEDLSKKIEELRHEMECLAKVKGMLDVQC